MVGDRSLAHVVTVERMHRAWLERLRRVLSLARLLLRLKVVLLLLVLHVLSVRQRLAQTRRQKVLMGHRKWRTRFIKFVADSTTTTTTSTTTATTANTTTASCSHIEGGGRQGRGEAGGPGRAASGRGRRGRGAGGGSAVGVRRVGQGPRAARAHAPLARRAAAGRPARPLAGQQLAQVGVTQDGLQRVGRQSRITRSRPAHRPAVLTAHQRVSRERDVARSPSGHQHVPDVGPVAAPQRRLHEEGRGQVAVLEGGLLARGTLASAAQHAARLRGPRLVESPGVEQRLQRLDLQPDLRRLLAVRLGPAAGSVRRSRPAAAAFRRVAAPLELLLEVLAVVNLALALEGPVQGQLDVAGRHVDEVQQVGRVLALLRVRHGRLELTTARCPVHVGLHQQWEGRCQHGAVFVHRSGCEVQLTVCTTLPTQLPNLRVAFARPKSRTSLRVLLSVLTCSSSRLSLLSLRVRVRRTFPPTVTLRTDCVCTGVPQTEQFHAHLRQTSKVLWQSSDGPAHTPLAVKARGA